VARTEGRGPWWNMDIPSMIMGAAIASVMWIAFWPRNQDREKREDSPRVD